MSNQHKVVEFEQTSAAKEAATTTPKPFLVVRNVKRFRNLDARQPNTILDYALSRGSMPA